ncbi:hypothetical protein HRR83_003630 [Exophiala dermatitidis]|uniref:Uncharacterized protein n=2 Tax=Exophiala dermatitidis TaxID=5970 RepID=H6BSX5_EXODN|nr:uncharacterized protein HMPREF1120_01617 [Exophiala dermatitidis NIH/UT8656]KAJ4519060.1 hypothetical protein HRR75_002738 [Exophiala dermatitidis]EHY53424.1 hypothetical protein HMPREF1120_01617 [Exophiala dermatitidis NIH/UT8656]KAJ4522405.1 hypothetical protein HRR74_002990 [Exophiala dermatitidis]KAJ4529730.1 hypothetical protein HRR73_000758 [Exophiala dermatitidis]KAJ4543104.1 hypothetical protein HRR77_005363 [Exophiala dermatitidis]
MAPSTRSSNRDPNRPSTHPYQTIQNVKPLQTEGSRRPGEEWDTIRRTRFYTAYDRRPEDESLRSLSRRLNISVSTACYLLKKREELGTAAYRRTRPLVQANGGHLGRPPKLAQETVEMLLSPRNPVRREPLRKQIAFHGLGVSKRRLQRRLKQGRKERLSRIRNEAARRRKERLEEERKREEKNERKMMEETEQAIKMEETQQQALPQPLQTETPQVLQTENKEETPRQEALPLHPETQQALQMETQQPQPSLLQTSEETPQASQTEKKQEKQQAPQMCDMR